MFDQHLGSCMHRIISAVLSALRGPCAGQEPQRHEREAAATPGTVQGVIDNRVLRRHRTSLSATVSFGFSGIPEQVRVRDINEKGLYFYTGLEEMSVGATIDLVILLPAEISPDGQERRVHYEAKLVRVEKRGDKDVYGVAASIKRCEIFPLPVAEGLRKEFEGSRPGKRELPLNQNSSVEGVELPSEVALKGDPGELGRGK